MDVLLSLDMLNFNLNRYGKEETNMLMENNLNKTSLFNAIERSLAMIVFDVDGRILWANKQFSQVIGYSLKELKNLHHRDLCLDEFKNSPEYQSFWKELRQNQAYHDKVQRLNKQGEILFLDAMYTPVLDDHGQVERVIKIANDITEQEKILKDSSTEFMEVVTEMTHYTNEVHDAFQQIVKGMGNLKEDANTMEDSVKEIGTIATYVIDIATRSNILGLNANIEAARAGEHGRGFAVVANEIRKMAETSKGAAEDITSQLMQIDKYVLAMITMVDQVTENVQGNSEAIAELRHAYLRIVETAERLSSIR